jgi:aminocarboxymuconate-semialdehyde decarboxylase
MTIADLRRGPQDLVVDAHAHIFLPDVESMVADRDGYTDHQALTAARQGSVSTAENVAMLQQRVPLMIDPERRLDEMTAADVDVQVISSPSQFHYWADAGLALDVALATNAGIAQACGQLPDRLVGLGAVPLQHPDLCVAALEDAVLGHGLRGVILSSHAELSSGETIELSHPALDPLWQRAAELEALIFLHPLGCTLGNRLNSWYLSNSVGQPIEHAVALSHLIFSGVFDRHPALQLLAAHGGGYLPTFLGRTDHAWTVRQDSHSCSRLPSSYMSQLYFDTCVHTPAALTALLAAVDPTHVVMGSDYPFDMGVDDPVDRLIDSGIDEDLVYAIAVDNPRQLRLVPEVEAGTARDKARQAMATRSIQEGQR